MKYLVAKPPNPTHPRSHRRPTINSPTDRPIQCGSNYQHTQVTLGPLGRNVVLARADAAPQIVNDGVTIAKEIEVANPEINIGVRLIQEVAKKSGAWIRSIRSGGGGLDRSGAGGWWCVS